MIRFFRVNDPYRLVVVLLILVLVRVTYGIIGMPLSYPELKHLLLGQWLGEGFSMYSETFDWEEGLNKTFSQAPGFYLVMAASLVVGLLIDVVDVSPIQALIATAVLYGLTAPILIGIVIHLCNRKDVMGEYTNSKASNILGFVTWGVMTACAIMLIIAFLE